MDLMGSILRALFRQHPASKLYETLEERLAAIEAAQNELSAENEEVIAKVRSWSAREAAKKRHEASRNLETLMEERGSGPEDAITDSGADGEVGGGEDSRMRRMQAERAERKAAIARQFRRQG
jgi:hypothetical protein